MKPIYYLKIILIGSVIVMLPIFYSCSHLGKQAPEQEGNLASDDGKYIVREYSIFNVSIYEQRGASTFRSGSSKCYLELYDGFTGKLISTKPFEIAGNSELLKITDTHVWLKSYNTKKSRSEILVINIPDFSTAFDYDELVKINNGLTFDNIYTYLNPPGINGIILQGDDARMYAINETSGKATVLSDTLHFDENNKGFIKMNDIDAPDKWMRFKGNNRQRLTYELKKSSQTQKTELSSEADFIYPYIIGRKDYKTEKDYPLIVNNGFIILSQSKNNGNEHNILTQIDTATLKTNWTQTLPTDTVGNNNDKLLQLQLHDNKLLVITKYAMALLDANKGKWIWQKLFFDKNDDD